MVASKKRYFPCLADFAAKYLLTPESSVYSECLFSKAGIVYKNQKSKLLLYNADKLVFLHHNILLLNFD